MQRKIMDNVELTPLPKWIQGSESKGYYVTLEPLICTNCGTEWFPRIKGGKEIVMPGTCPNNKCRTAAYRKIRKQ